MNETCMIEEGMSGDNLASQEYHAQRMASRAHFHDQAFAFFFFCLRGCGISRAVGVRVIIA